MAQFNGDTCPMNNVTANVFVHNYVDTKGWDPDCRGNIQQSVYNVVIISLLTPLCLGNKYQDGLSVSRDRQVNANRWSPLF